MFTLAILAKTHSCTHMHTANPFPLPCWLTGIMQLKGRYKTKDVHDGLLFRKLASLNEALEVGLRDPTSPTGQRCVQAVSLCVLIMWHIWGDRWTNRRVKRLSSKGGSKNMLTKNSQETRFLHYRNGHTDGHTDGRTDGRTDGQTLKKWI